MKCLRLEDDSKRYLDRQKGLEEKNNKLCKQLEENLRVIALQEARNKREKSAADNVRIGEITKVQTSSGIYCLHTHFLRLTF